MRLAGLKMPMELTRRSTLNQGPLLPDLIGASDVELVFEVRTHLDAPGLGGVQLVIPLT